jgi:hypothetical protein
MEHVTEYVSPFSCIIANFPMRYDSEGKGLTPGTKWLEEMLVARGYRVKKVHPAWTRRGGFMGHAVIEFLGSTREDYLSAKKLENVFKHHGRDHGAFSALVENDEPYLWCSTKRDCRVYLKFRYAYDTIFICDDRRFRAISDDDLQIYHEIKARFCNVNVI